MAPPDARIVDHVARDVGQLERQPQVAGAVQDRIVAHAHHAGHHHADDACDVIGIFQHVIQRAIVARLDIHREAFDQVHGPGLREIMPPRHRAQRGKGRGHRTVALQGRQRVDAQAVQPRLRVVHRLGAAAQGLTVDHVIRVAAPGIEHHRVVADARRHQLGRRGKALRPLGDRLGRGQDQIAHAPARSDSITWAVALAEPTTPGMPAPGWVPAPTR